jgi:hypothetical protein
MKYLLAGAVMAAGLSLSAPALAVTLFTEDFESYATGVPAAANGLAPNWTINPGTVDVIGTGTIYQSWYPTKFIDMNGTPDSAARIETAAIFALTAGQSYVLSFDLGNNKNSNHQEGLAFGVGTNTSSLTIAGAIASFLPKSFSFVANATGLFSIFFQDQNLSSGDAGGPILDNIVLSAVPVPAGLPLLGAGLGALGLLGWRARRRSRSAAPLAV